MSWISAGFWAVGAVVVLYVAYLFEQGLVIR